MTIRSPAATLIVFSMTLSASSSARVGLGVATAVARAVAVPAVVRAPFVVLRALLATVVSVGVVVVVAVGANVGAGALACIGIIRNPTSGTDSRMTAMPPATWARSVTVPRERVESSIAANLRSRRVWRAMPTATAVDRGAAVVSRARSSR